MKSPVFELSILMIAIGGYEGDYSCNIDNSNMEALSQYPETHSLRKV